MWQVKVLFGQAAAHWAAGLDGFEAFIVFDAAADIVYDFAKGDAKGHFDEAGLLYVTSQSKGFCAFAALGTESSVPFGAAKDDLGDVSVGLNIVDIGGFAP